MDCGGNCPAKCGNCDVDLDRATGIPRDRGNAANSHSFSFGNIAVIKAAIEAMDESDSRYTYGLSGMSNQQIIDLMKYTIRTRYTSDQKMKAVADYVHKNMAWASDEDDWPDGVEAARIITHSGARMVKKARNDPKERCNDSSIPIHEKKVKTKVHTNPKYCGDCEDHAFLRAALLRHLGVAAKCVFVGEHHSAWGQPANDSDIPPWRLPASERYIDPNGPVGRPHYLDEEVSGVSGVSDTSKKKCGDGTGGHAFNIVFYQSKFRIMDYYDIDYYFSNIWACHQADKVWNDTVGRYWNGPPTPPPDYVHNYLGTWRRPSHLPPPDPPFEFPIGNRCYENGKRHWNYRTLHKDVCP